MAGKTGSDLGWQKQERLSSFLERVPSLTPRERERIVEQALLLVEQYYVHLPFKREVHDVEPAGELRFLQRRLPAIDGDRLFHGMMCDIFNRLRDFHTAYHLPSPYAANFAFLPFQIGALGEPGDRRYIVTHVLKPVGDRRLRPGLDVETWNGSAVHRVVARDAQANAGANPDAQYARALDAMTIRPMVRMLPPAEPVVHVGFRDAGGHRFTLAFPWRIGRPAPEPSHQRVHDHSARHHLALDSDSDLLRQARKTLYAPHVVAAERRTTKPAPPGHRPRRRDDSPEQVASRMPGLFTAAIVRHGGQEYGYIRIRSFKVRSADHFLQEFLHLTRGLPASGLILDVRGNSGGLVAAAERLLQLLTPRPIEPQGFQFLATDAVLQICKRQARPNSDPDLSVWVPLVKRAIAERRTWCEPHPMTSPEDCNRIGQRYHGPVALIVDARCYSACDIFIAGFADHAIGRIIGTSGATGAGGANVWQQADLRSFADPGSSAFAALPKGGELRVAIRRSLRVGPRAGIVLEERGVTPDEVYRLTENDLLGGDRDLLAHACEYLSGQPYYALDASLRRSRGTPTTLKVQSRNLDSLLVEVQGRVLDPARGGTDKFIIEEAASGRIDVLGLSRGAPVAARRLWLAPPERHPSTPPVKCRAA